MIKLKKLFLCIALIFICFMASTQNTLQSYALQIGHWNYYSEKYSWEAIRYCDVTFLFQGDIILADDEAHSTYYTYEVIAQNDVASSWNALDEEKRKCIVSLVSGEDVTFIVIYNDICYKYYVIID